MEEAKNKTKRAQMDEKKKKNHENIPARWVRIGWGGTGYSRQLRDSRQVTAVGYVKSCSFVQMGVA